MALSIKNSDTKKQKIKWQRKAWENKEYRREENTILVGSSFDESFKFYSTITKRGHVLEIGS